jgi:two-component system sensor histidine kinase HydH
MASRFTSSPAGIVLAVAGIVLISLLRYLAPASMLVWHNILQHLYYLPIAFAGMYRGWKGGLGAAVFSAICYVTLFAVRPNPTREFAPYAEIIDFFLVGLVVGILGDRERRQKQALERTSRQLGQVYRELQENFERMKRAERLYAIGQLSAGLAHEIRNPLASIEGAASILQNDSGSEERRLEFLTIIQRECRRLNRLLTQFLDFARPRPPEYGSVDIGHLLESVINLAQHGASEGIRLRKEVAPNLPVVRSDPEQLKQVILNLTINAIQGMPEGGEILLSARQREDKVLIQVRDEGCGISQEHLDKVFDPFFTTKKDGTGLGLSVAHQIVSQHGGMLGMERNPDKGMTFSVSLPLSETA